MANNGLKEIHMKKTDNEDRWWANVRPSGHMLRPSDVFKRTQLSRSQIYEMIGQGTFPPFVKLSKRAAALPEAWLEKFIERRVEVSLNKEKGLK